jgi:hypothetical protein
LIIDRKWLIDSARSEAERHFDQDRLLCIIPRETAWYAITLLDSGSPGDLALANEIISAIEVRDGTHSPCTLYAILQHYKERLQAEARDNILRNLESNLPISALVQYTDGNVNHPVAAFVNLILSGELTGNKSYLRLGTALLKDFWSRISGRRHGALHQAEMSEYMSPTYTAVTLWFLAAAVEFAQEPAARNISLALEQGLWRSLAMHWHEPTHQFCGPFSRAYTEDSLGGFSALHCTMGYASGKDIYIDPELARKYSHPSALIQNAFISILDFHLPEDFHRIAYSKPLPYYLRKTTYCEQYQENCCDQSSGYPISTFDTEVYPGGWGDITSYLTEEYCMGTASRPYVNGGQCDSFSIRYRKAPEIKSNSDFRGAYTRMVFNGAEIGKAYTAHVTNCAHGKDLLYEEGRSFIYQHKNKAIVCYSPKRAGHCDITELRLDIIFSFKSCFHRIWIDGDMQDEFPAELKSVKKIIIQDFNTCILLMPLYTTLINDFKGMIRFSDIGDHYIISIYNYKGDGINLSRNDMSLTRNGFACLVAGRGEFARADDFLAYCEKISVAETLKQQFIRNIEFNINEDVMNFQIDPISERIVERSWNGKDDSVQHLDIEAGENLKDVTLFNTLY